MSSTYIADGLASIALPMPQQGAALPESVIEQQSSPTSELEASGVLVDLTASQEGYVAKDMQQNDENELQETKVLEEQQHVDEVCNNTAQQHTSIKVPPSCYIADGLANIKLPLPDPNPVNQQTPPTPRKPEPVVEQRTVCVGDEVTSVFGRGKVLDIRDDGVHVVQARGWTLAHNTKALFYFQKSAVKWVAPKPAYQMRIPEIIDAAAEARAEGTALFQKDDAQGALNHYTKAITCLQYIRENESSNAEKAQILEIMVPCHSNIATCHLKLNNATEAAVSAKNVVLLCSALVEHRTGAVMAQLKLRGITETKILMTWKRKALYLQGKANYLKKDFHDASTALSEALKLSAKSSAKEVDDIRKYLTAATAQANKQDAKTKKMWAKAFNKSAADTADESPSSSQNSTPSGSRRSSSSSMRTSDEHQAAAGSRRGSFKTPLQSLLDQAAGSAAGNTGGASGRSAANGVRSSSKGDSSTEEDIEQPLSDAAFEGSSSPSGGGWGTGTWLTVGAGAVAVAAVAAIVLSRRSKS